MVTTLTSLALLIAGFILGGMYAESRMKDMEERVCARAIKSLHATEESRLERERLLRLAEMLRRINRERQDKGLPLVAEIPQIH